MCSTDIPAPPAPPAPPPILEQLAPRSSRKESDTSRKRTGMSRYKIDPNASGKTSAQLGGIPKRTGV